MPKAIYLTLATMILTAGCAKDGSNGSASGGSAGATTSAAAPANTDTPVQAAAKCGDVVACTNECMVSHPFYSPPQMTADFCGSALAAGGNCSSIVSLFTPRNNAKIDANSACLALPVTQVLVHPASSAPACSFVPRCAFTCDILYPFTTIEAIERAAAATGGISSDGTLMQIYSNGLAIAQHSACLELPSDQI